MSAIDRREAVQRLAAVAGVAFTWTDGELFRAHGRRRAAAAAGRAFQAEFFTAHEYQTVRVLVDLILPRDARSGSATDAGVPEFMDFMMIDRPDGQTRMRGGLAWLDAECRERFGAGFIACSDEQRRELLNLIAWPDRAPAELSHGVAFFNMFRDLTSSGFWSSRMGVEDLRYIGNTYVAEWHGCPVEQLRKIGLQ